MEIKAELLKPYTDVQRIDFIVEQNHQNGYEIKETNKALEAWGYTEEEKAAEREAQFHKEFFNTSLGYIRRTVSMKDGSKKDFLGELLMPIKAGLELGQQVTIITYIQPDFSEDVTDWEQYQEKKQATTQFIQDCLNQIVIDFQGVEA